MFSKKRKYTLHLGVMLTVLQAVLALLASRIQITQASNSTISPSSLVVLSSTIQYNITANSSSLYETQTASTRTNVIPSVSPSSVANGSKSSAFTRYSNSMTATEVTASVTEPTISIMQSNYTTTSSTPTTVLTVKGLPDGKVIAVLAGILGAALLILLGIIIWHLCIVHTLERRPSSRVQPSDMNRSASELL